MQDTISFDGFSRR
jgi:hypothetical protein